MQRDLGLEPALRKRWAVGAGKLLDLARSELVGADGQPVELRAQALQVLLVLGERAGQVVGKDELMQRVWGDVVVTEDSLVQAVSDIRRALGDEQHRCVRTVPRRGYMLVAEEEPLPVLPVPPTATASPASAATAAAAATSPATPPAVRKPWWPAAIGIAVLLGAIALVAWTASAVWRDDGAPSRSLAVLPFESAEGTDAWFVEGVSNDLGTILSSWTGVKVIGRGTMATYKGRPVDPRQVGRELGVRHVVTGSARREGDRVRLAVSLVDARSGQEVWSELRDVPRAELPALVGDVAGGIARTMTVQYGDVVGADARALAPHEVRADDLAMQGLAELLRSVARENWERASKSFEAGLALDPDCVRCLGGLTLVQSGLVIWEWASDRAASLAKAERTLARLKELAPERQITHMGAWNLAFIGQDLDGAMAIADRLAEHYPNDPVSHHYRCSSLLRLGRFEESIAACERAQRISPRDSRVSVWQGLVGFNEFQLGRYVQAEQGARASVLANPRVPFYSLVLAAALAEQGRRDEAAAVLRDAAARHPDFRASRIIGIWGSRDARFLAGRDRIVSWVVELGFPP